MLFQGDAACVNSLTTYLKKDSKAKPYLFDTHIQADRSYAAVFLVVKSMAQGTQVKEELNNAYEALCASSQCGDLWQHDLFLCYDATPAEGGTKTSTMLTMEGWAREHGMRHSEQVLGIDTSEVDPPQASGNSFLWTLGASLFKRSSSKELFFRKLEACQVDRWCFVPPPVPGLSPNKEGRKEESSSSLFGWPSFWSGALPKPVLLLVGLLILLAILAHEDDRPEVVQKDAKDRPEGAEAPEENLGAPAPACDEGVDSPKVLQEDEKATWELA